jgi:L-alanine-DL-glutamate epimerase-like enolase superfamily enzyme
VIISEVRSIIRHLPLREEQSMGGGHLRGEIQNVFVRITTNDGTQGYGEASSWTIFTDEIPAGIKGVIDHYLAPLLLGCSPLDINMLLQKMDRAILGNPHAKSAVEMALWDLAGKILHVPAVVLWGGPLRSSLGLSYSVSAQDLAKERESICSRYNEGYRIFKLKVGVLDWQTDLKRLDQLATLYPDISIRLDFNCLGDPLTIHHFLQAARAYRIDYLEQPFQVGNTQALTRLRQITPIPISIDESCASVADLQALCQQQMGDIVSLKVGKIGGLTTARVMGAIAAAWGIQCYAGALSETRLATTAALHAMLTLPTLIDGCDYYFSLVTLADDAIHGGFIVQNGRVSLPPDPGLGVEVPESWFE